MNEERWKSYDRELKDELYPLLSNIFGIPVEHMTYKYAFLLSDILICEHFHGLTERTKDLTTSDWEYLKRTTMITFEILQTDLYRKILGSIYITPILEVMKQKINEYINVTYDKDTVDTYDNAAFILFSSHDKFLYEIFTLIKPTNIEIEFIDFGSDITFELHQKETDTCFESHTFDCFYIKSFYNDVQLKLEHCPELECPIIDFITKVASFEYDEESCSGEIKHFEASIYNYRNELLELHEEHNSKGKVKKEDL